MIAYFFAPTNLAKPIGQTASDIGASVANNGKKAKRKLSDAAITAQIKTGLIADPSIRASKINVDTIKGTVYLKGEVQSKEAMNSAINISRDVEGVEQVINELQILSDQ
ncbi:MAG: BON domain-containing protein [Candidatus Caenarcaniphilales bacterium]|nr:BON domain-containing protein [Candidatus Caenarcaniphilales bacterium]